MTISIKPCKPCESNYPLKNAEITIPRTWNNACSKLNVNECAPNNKVVRVPTMTTAEKQQELAAIQEALCTQGYQMITKEGIEVAGGQLQQYSATRLKFTTNYQTYCRFEYNGKVEATINSGIILFPYDMQDGKFWLNSRCFALKDGVLVKELVPVAGAGGCEPDKPVDIDIDGKGGGLRLEGDGFYISVKETDDNG